jgi:hypothetical protein
MLRGRRGGAATSWALAKREIARSSETKKSGICRYSLSLRDRGAADGHALIADFLLPS